jgi:ribonuclease BN (tRNA processing enzyme)
VQPTSFRARPRVAFPSGSLANFLTPLISLYTMGKMKIDVLGCYGNVVGKYRATAFLVNESLLVDAGTCTEVLNDGQLKRIKNVVISHPHLDHTKGLFPLVDELIMMGGTPIMLHGVKETLLTMSQNLFNNVIWPDFTKIPSVDNAFLTFSELVLEGENQVGALVIKPVAMDHTVYTTGFLVQEDGKGFMYTADTGLSSRFWEVAALEKGVEFIIADVSFPNRLEHLAKKSGHMTLSMLVERLETFGLKSVPTYITHMKPLFLNEIMGELAGLGRGTIKALEQDTTIVL